MTLAVDTALLREPNLWVPRKKPLGAVRAKPPFNAKWKHIFLCNDLSGKDEITGKYGEFSQNSAFSSYKNGKAIKLPTFIFEDFFQVNSGTPFWWVFHFETGGQFRISNYDGENGFRIFFDSDRFISWFKYQTSTNYDLMSDYGPAPFLNSYTEWDNTCCLVYCDPSLKIVTASVNGKSRSTGYSAEILPLVGSSKDTLGFDFLRTADYLYMFARGEGVLTSEQIDSITTDPYQFFEPA